MKMARKEMKYTAQLVHLKQKGNLRVIAIKNAVTVKNRPNLQSTRTVTTNLESMNPITKKQAKPSRMVRESPRAMCGVGCEFELAVALNQRPTQSKKHHSISPVHFAMLMLNHQSSACNSSSSTSLLVGEFRNRGSSFDKIGTIYVRMILKNSFAFEFKFMF